MEHRKTAGKSKSKIFKFLPKATSSVWFHNPSIYSPVKDKRSTEKTNKSNLGIGFSGPIVSLVPPETRRKIKNDTTYALIYEPTSPKVSCMGHVKCKHYLKLAGAGKVTNKPANEFSRIKSHTAVSARASNKKADEEKVTKVDPVIVKSEKKLGFRRLLFRGGAGGSRRKSDATADNVSKTGLTVPKAPCLSTMKRFSSGRDAFMSFDWTTQVAPVDSDDRNCFNNDESDCVKVVIPSSAPVTVRNKGICDDFVRVGGMNMEPRKEINLWKRRTMAKPPPLQLHVI